MVCMAETMMMMVMVTVMVMAGTFLEGQKKSGRETGGDMKSFNVKDKMEFTWVDCFLAHYCEKC